MKNRLPYIILLLMLALLVSCKEDIPVIEKEGDYMQLGTRAGENSGSDVPCFIFWTFSDYNSSVGFPSNPTAPYVYNFPTDTIGAYKTIKYNTQKIYPSSSETVYAVGVSPGVLVPPGNSNWTTFDIPESLAGITDIMCAAVISGNAQTKFPDPLNFEHQLARLEFRGYCGASMVESTDRFIDVKDIKITISSDVDNQWNLFPEELQWSHGGVGVGKYEIIAYGSAPISPIVAQVSSSNPSPGTTLVGKVDNSELRAKPIGNFYLVPGFDQITIKVEATYIDSTTDGIAPGGNGQEIKRVWEEMLIEKIHSPAGDPTEIGTSYTIYLGFERSRIVVGVTLKDWDPEIIS